MPMDSMTHTPTVAVTGATGLLGGRIARLLSEEAGLPLRLPVRDATRAPALAQSQAVDCDYADTASVRTALEGIETVLMVSFRESEHRLAQHRAFIDGAVAAGVRHLVYISFLGAAPDATFVHARDHFHTEEYLRGSGLAWTFLRDSLYADFVPELVTDGAIRGPGGNGRVSWVAQDDIAAAAAAVVRDPAPHAGCTYDLTGPEALTLDETAALLSRASGSEIAYVGETLDQARESRSGFGAPEWLVEVWISTYTAIAKGELESVSDDIERLTGRPPMRLAEVL